jgi:hypothetical protein
MHGYILNTAACWTAAILSISLLVACRGEKCDHVTCVCIIGSCSRHDPQPFDASSTCWNGQCSTYEKPECCCNCKTGKKSTVIGLIVGASLATYVLLACYILCCVACRKKRRFHSGTNHEIRAQTQPENSTAVSIEN